MENQKGDPLAFVSIGIPEQNIGTISEENGYFELTVPLKYAKSLVTFSSVGYDRRELSIEFLLGNKDPIVLQEKMLQLDEIVIRSTRLKTKITRLGSLKWSAGRFMNDSTYAGSSIAQLIRSPHDTTYVQYVEVGYYNRIENLKLRIRFQEPDKNGLPGHLLLEREIIVPLNTYEGFQKIDIEEHNIAFTENEFFIVLEPLITRNHRKEFHRLMTHLIKEYPENVKINSDGEVIVDDPAIDLNFIQFKVSNEVSTDSFYSVNSFGKWYPSESMALVVGVHE